MAHRPARRLLRLAKGLAAAFCGIAGALAPLGSGPAEACTRAVYLGSGGVNITGRTMDWAEDMRTNLWAFPAGIARTGAAGGSTPKWTSKYGSLIASGYDVGTADGINDQGLVANLLYLAESEYPAADGKPVLSMALWAQYVLDNFATVNEAVEALSKETFVVRTAVLPNGRAAQLHLAISDASGDSAIFEYLGGKLMIHHGRQYQVMTNSPSFDQQLALDAYWQQIGGDVFLPGTFRAADRFARASFFIKSLPTKAEPAIVSAVPDQSYENQAVASVASVMRSVSVPLGFSMPGAPNLAQTIWRTVSDQKNKVYYFDSSTSPNSFWVPLADLDLKPGAPVKKLTLTGGKVYAGNAAALFETAKPFTFMPVDMK
ncbi:linear amide C-N hydrolase [Xanthobacter tagetidis]|uniref:Linear amide C-N hydrolase n=1 Tax=Xanthobacter tagetidis TaxID=60216 RepID=A0A3L7AQX3_9HYPH|nr:linear amide C-N hydrolase [Xanthobacter tagetidis]MBB6308252.1 choloylglycine hydrolase [Xanthobacter tagetidis]RLP81862.1 linear amide C-N hydrolase [Xanthobacter tagetidis]